MMRTRMCAVWLAVFGAPGHVLHFLGGDVSTFQGAAGYPCWLMIVMGLYDPILLKNILGFSPFTGNPMNQTVLYNQTVF